MKKSLVLVLFLAACSKTEQPVAQKAAAPNQAAAAPVASASPAIAPASNLLTGKVVETFNGGGYTYVRVATGQGEQWAAIPEAQVKKGDTVSIAAQMTMEKFESKTLNRTFDTIVFGSIAGPADAAPAGAPAMQAQMPPGHPAQDGKVADGKFPPQMMSALSQTASQHMKAADAGDVKVEKPAGGRSVAEVWTEKSALNGKEVVVRGKVVKFLGGIMGTNWMHVQDGTGSKEKGDNDLTVTTNEKVKVGDVVTIKGTVAADKDFGAGYKYAVIVEKATVVP
jgi:ribosomal protein S17